MELSPKEKAKELVNRFLPHSQDTEHKENNNIWEEKVTEAIQCALICVDEKIKSIIKATIVHPHLRGEIEELEKVKQEIEKL